MAREGTRSATGNSRPRVFPAVPETTVTAVKKRTKANTGEKRGPKTTTKASKPTGVTKKAPAKKAPAATKSKVTVKKVEGAAASTTKKAAAPKKAKVGDALKKAAASKK